ncbi:MAG: metallophosphoesterase family protein [Planctomycetota bacterium]|jgi:hypothetical protein
MKSKRSLRHPADVHGIGRGAASSAWRTHAQTGRVAWEELRLDGAAETKASLRSRLLLLTSNVLAWAWNYTRYVFRRRYRPFPTYESGGSKGLIEMEGSTIALAGDWGSGTYSAYQVADRIRALEPDYTIHLGDVYYSGTRKEFDQYFLPEDAWPEGKKGTFALNGNHEMYSGGGGYFEALKTEKMSHEVGGVRRPQTVSYFCLQNAHWRVLAVDTAYYARRFPFLELADTHLIKLHAAIETWLEEVVFQDPDDRRPVILLSHHEWFSSYDSEYKRMGSQLTPYLDRVLLWLWGHEHRFSGYGPHGADGGPKVRARCIGHGGIPFDIDYPERHRNLVFSDERISAESTNYVDAKQQLGYCGFALLKFDGPKLTISYFDEREGSDCLLEETWTRDPEAGTAQGEIEGGELLAKYRDGYPKVPPKRVPDAHGAERLRELGGSWPL